MTPVVEIAGLRVRFRAAGLLEALLHPGRPRHIDGVARVDLAIAPGETLGLVGESGSGKTTLARAIAGLVAVSEGDIRFEGRPVAGLSDRALKPVRRQMALMFQDPVSSLSPRKTVRSLVLEPFRIHGLPLPDPEAEARALMALVGLPAGLLGAYPHQLSGGQARRVGVARALALRPRLVIADEPTAGLDVSVQGEILNLLARLQAELGLSHLIVTHNLPVVRHVSDRLAIMYLGRLVEVGPTAAVFARPAHPYTAALVAAIPLPDPDRSPPPPALSGEVPSLHERPAGCEFHTRCPRAAARCRQEAPLPRELGGGRSVACHDPLT